MVYDLGNGLHVWTSRTELDELTMVYSPSTRSGTVTHCSSSAPAAYVTRPRVTQASRAGRAERYVTATIRELVRD